MIETYEIRLFSKYLSLVSDSTPSHRKFPTIAVTVRGAVGDPQFIRIGELHRKLRQSNLGLAFGSWTISRRYSEEELARAELFCLNVLMTEVAAEEYGTEYRDVGSCEFDGKVLQHFGGTDFRVVRAKVRCRLGSSQVGSLRLPIRKFKRNRDVYRIWGGELVVSERLASLASNGQFSGSALLPISDISEVERGVNEGKAPRRNLSQLILQSKPLEVAAHSRFGETPFDTESGGYHRCGAGVIAGLRPISPLSIVGSSWDGSDLCRTAVYVSARVGLFRPYQLLVVSKRFFAAVREHGMTGFQFEVIELA
jgi:hypothetical protein